jgi:hypothetical protein
VAVMSVWFARAVASMIRNIGVSEGSVLGSHGWLNLST